MTLDYTGYAVIEDKLRSKGFTNDYESGVICRYQIRGIIVDVMPTSKEILGFANQWYEEAVAHCIFIHLGEGYDIRIFAAPYFLATKIEAFADRGDDDGRFSTDFEDIVYLLNNRSTIWQELRESPESLRAYLRMKLSLLSDNPYIDEWISCHLDYSEQKRVHLIAGKMRDFVIASDT